MRDVLVKLYADEDEADMIQKMARENELSVNEYLRHILFRDAMDYNLPKANLFTRRTHRSKPRSE